MKVLQIGKFHPIRGGVEKVMLDLTLGLSQRGIDCDMLCANAGEDAEELVLNPHANLFRTHTVTKLKGTMISPDMIMTLKRIASDYDIIHLHHPDPMAAFALKMSGYAGPVVLHWHSDILRQKLLLQAYRPLQRWIIDRADLIVTTSEAYLKGSEWLEHVHEKARALPIGVEEVQKPAVTPERVLELSEGRKVVFSLGRLVPYKGYTNLIEAAKYLPDDYRVVIGGSGPLHDELQAQIEASGLQDKVVLIGRISEEERNSWFYHAEMFCLPSVIKTEAFGVVLIESMSTGLPLVATNIPGSGTGWVNEHGVSGLNAEINDPKGLADAILGVSAKREEFARGARRRWEEWFTSERMIDGCEALYRELRGG